MKTTSLMLLSAAFALSAMASCSQDDHVPVASQTYVLVHGAWQAPYVWDDVRAKLISAGNKVIVVELPGHGSDQTPTHQLSLDVYRDKVIEAMGSGSDKVILVGHSMGGMVVTHVAEKVPSRIRKLVYIGAFVPVSGQALIEIQDPGSQLGPALVQSADQLTLDVKKERLADLFIPDGSQDVKDKVIANYRAEPAIPFTNKVLLSPGAFGSVDKAYIKTLQDIVISPALQDQMLKAAGIKSVYEVNTGHSPFLSQPNAVADLLLNIGK
ncbi:alpha/beta fold hydrolase [Dyadobacter sp. OTU695]|uniref:alpha/beta fold hydrolase n=1 Tax=Dyadobacter sp. OTU695 TaxID=3043860 RepID=UPI00313EFD0C